MTRRAAVCAAGLALGVLLGGALGAAGQRASGKAGPSVSFLGELPPLFVENRGQTHPAVAFLVQGLGRTLFFTDAGVVVALREGQRQQVLRLVFVGARRVRPVGADRQAAVFSWFKGAQPSGWRRSVASWGRVAYRDLWPGIDLVWTAEGERLKYGFVVAPGADPGRIVLRWEGADAVTVDETGALRLATPLGALVDDAPLAWQEGPGGREAVAAGWSVTPADTAEAPTVRFRLGAYDPTAALVIDPAVLVYCGYIGGERTDQVFGLAVDSVGHLFITGVTGSSEASFPVAVGPCLTYAWDGDAFVAKLDPSGQTLLYCGYLGGREYDNGRSIAVDGAGNAYITGVA
ncbi:MAG: SBBP repeat-containing protein, partial [Planctomycetes bacterium]|nr:SBBP repeat-containing protein [Planctomycetota bacterium]